MLILTKMQYIWLGTREVRLELMRNWLNHDSLLESLAVWVCFWMEISQWQTVNYLYRSSFSKLCQIWVMWRNLLFCTAVTLIHSFIMTRLDYWDSTFAGLPRFWLCLIQSVFNSAARVIDKKPKYWNITEYTWEICYAVFLLWSLLLPRHHADTVVSSALAYIRKCCVPVSSQLGQWSLRSAANGGMQVLHFFTLTPSCFLVLDRPGAVCHCTYRYTLLPLNLCSIPVHLLS